MQRLQLSLRGERNAETSLTQGSADEGETVPGYPDLEDMQRKATYHHHRALDALGNLRWAKASGDTVNWRYMQTALAFHRVALRQYRAIIRERLDAYVARVVHLVTDYAESERRALGTRLGYENLRAACPCAHCRGTMLDPDPESNANGLACCWCEGDGIDWARALGRAS